MRKIIINANQCKGCGLCAAFCPKGVLVMSQELSARGVNAAAVTDCASCTGCLNCAVMCPDAAIEVTGNQSAEV